MSHESWSLVEILKLNFDQLVTRLKSSYFGESTQLLGPLCLWQSFTYTRPESLAERAWIFSAQSTARQSPLTDGGPGIWPSEITFCRANLQTFCRSNLQRFCRSNLQTFCRENLQAFCPENLQTFCRGNFQRVGIEQLCAFMFCCYCEGGCSVQPNKYKTALKRELFVTKRMDTLTDTSRYEVYTWGSSFISSKISSSSSSSRTTFSKTNREIQPAQLWVYPDWKAALRNFVKILPIFPVYHFFRQNIWHAIFDQFQFHCIFGDESLENNDSQKQQKDFGDQLNGYQREDLQLFWCTEGDSTNIYILQISISHWGRLSKKLFRGFFSANDLICHSQKFQLCG